MVRAAFASCVRPDSLLTRSEPKVIQTFAELWGTDELLVSFDAVNVTFPYGEHGRTDEPWVTPWPYVAFHVPLRIHRCLDLSVPGLF